MRIFKNKAFTRFARKASLADVCEAVSNAERGLIDADLGGGVIKQCIARPGGGKSGGFPGNPNFDAYFFSNMRALGEAVVLVGQRRIGKTSLLNRIHWKRLTD